MAHGDIFYPTKLDNLHSSFTNNYLLKHGNIFTKPELPTGNGYSFSFYTADVGRYNTDDRVRGVMQDCDVPLNFAIKHEKPPTPPASTSPIATKSPPLPTQEENGKNPGLQFPIDESKNSTWILGKQKLSWDNSTVASYNPETKMFRCVVCNAVGFLSRIAEHYLGTHTSAKVFQCLHCPYSSTWSRCVRMHMAKHHSVPNAPPSLWKGQPLLEEIFQLLTNLKTAVDSQGRDRMDPELNDKKFVCPKCPYTTDRRDLYLRHENIHKEDKPYHCYICFKLFNRADHVKKHFLRIHRGHPYDISLVRRRPPRNGSSYSTNGKNATTEIKPYSHDNKNLSKPIPTNVCTLTDKSDINPTSLKLDPISNTSLPTHFECPYCPWEGADAWSLRNHLDIHIKIFECPICEYKSGKAERLFTHVYKAHMMLICTKCKFVSDQAQRFENHIKDCCVEMVIGSPYQKSNLENMSSDAKRNPESVLVAKDVNLPPIASTSGYFPAYFPQSQKIPTNLKDTKGSLSIIPLHNSVSYCFPTQPLRAHELCNPSVSLAESTMRVSESIRIKAKTWTDAELKCETNVELTLPHENASDSKTSDDIKNSNELDLVCWECGCEFANESSLENHSELYHRVLESGNTSEPAPTNRKRFSCALCNFSSKEQRMILDHMRYHTGEMLKCKAGAECNFSTIFDATLREHVQERHLDGRKRCPHCGILSEERVAFIRHYRRCHHSTSCYACRDLRRSFTTREGESAVSSNSSSSSSSSCAEIRPYLHHNPYSKTNNAIAPYNSRNTAMAKVAVSIPSSLEPLDEDNQIEIIQTIGNIKKSRKQTTPRKLIHSQKTVSTNDALLIESNISRCDTKFSEISSRGLLLCKKKFVKESSSSSSSRSVWCCKLCYKKPLHFKNHVNYVLHQAWYHFPKKRKCKKCKAVFKHAYQLLIHKKKTHIEKHALN